MSLLNSKRMLERTYLNLISIHGLLIGSFTFLGFLTGDIYAHFLQKVLVELVYISVTYKTTIVFFYLEPKGIFLILALQ
jgi:hypothetical protein